MSKQIYPPEGHTPPVWGITVTEYVGPEGVPSIQLDVNGPGYVKGSLGDMAALINELQMLMTVMKLSGRSFETSIDVRRGLHTLLGGCYE